MESKARRAAGVTALSMIAVGMAVMPKCRDQLCFDHSKDMQQLGEPIFTSGTITVTMASFTPTNL